MKFGKGSKARTVGVVFRPVCGSVDEARALTRGFGSFDEMYEAVQKDYRSSMYGVSYTSLFVNAVENNSLIDHRLNWKNMRPVIAIVKYGGNFCREVSMVIGYATDDVESTGILESEDKTWKDMPSSFDYSTWYALKGPAGYVSNVRTVVNATDAAEGRGPLVETCFTFIPLLRVGMPEEVMMFRLERYARELACSSELSNDIKVVRWIVGNDGLFYEGEVD